MMLKMGRVWRWAGLAAAVSLSGLVYRAWRHLSGPSGGSSASDASLSHECDFCGSSQPEVHLEEMADGRERCPPCSDVAVDQAEHLVRIYNHARGFLVDGLRLALRQNVHIRSCLPEEIASLDGSQFIPTPRFDSRAVGRAVDEQGTATVLIESGQPYHMTLATMVHELVHVWQFDHLNLDRVEKESGLSLIEGLATWAEVECLRQARLAPEYLDSVTSRHDIYGQGYRSVLEIATITGREPFDLIREQYGKQ